MNNLTKALQEIKDRAEKNLAEAKQLIQPEQSWIEDNTDLLRLVKALELCMEQRRRAMYNEILPEERALFFCDKILDLQDREIESILEGK